MWERVPGSSKGGGSLATTVSFPVYTSGVVVAAS